MTFPLLQTEATYVADGRTAVWRVPFPYRTPADVGVKIIDAEGLETVLVIGKNYMLQGFDVFCFVPRGQTVKIWLKAPVTDVLGSCGTYCPGMMPGSPCPPPPVPYQDGMVPEESESLPGSGVIAGSYGPAEDATPAAGGKVVVPQITIASNGTVTEAEDKEITLPGTFTGISVVKAPSSTNLTGEWLAANNGYANADFAGGVPYMLAIRATEGVKIALTELAVPGGAKMIQINFGIDLSEINGGGGSPGGA